MAICACQRSFKMTFSDDPKLDALCPSCRASSNPLVGYQANKEFTQGTLTSNPLPDAID